MILHFKAGYINMANVECIEVETYMPSTKESRNMKEGWHIAEMVVKFYCISGMIKTYRVSQEELKVLREKLSAIDIQVY